MVDINGLVNGITLVLSQEKAYNVPNVCSRYGLRDGEESEAMYSRRVYIEKRLKTLTQLQLIDLAKRVANDYNSKDLAKQIALISPNGIFQISELTRRNIMTDLHQMGSIEGELDLIDFLKRTWKLDEMPSTDPRYSNLTGDIIQHMYNNSDYEIDYLFTAILEVYNIPDEIFIVFIEQVVHPMVRKIKQFEYIENINNHLIKDGFNLQQTDQISGYPIFRVSKLFDGVKGNVKHIIFAADGNKPEIILTDSLSMDIKIAKYEELCLVYDQPIPSQGLYWNDLVKWWSERIEYKDTSLESLTIERQLYARLFKSLDSAPEKFLYDSFFTLFKEQLGEKFPALIPQVYLHYDPYTLKQLPDGKRLDRQRMDFLFLFSNHIRIVIEVDGKQHYSEDDKPSPRIYSEMVSADRELKLNGYEVFRFGGYELMKNKENLEMLKNFFTKLIKKYVI